MKLLPRGYVWWFSNKIWKLSKHTHTHTHTLIHPHPHAYTPAHTHTYTHKRVYYLRIKWQIKYIYDSFSFFFTRSPWNPIPIFITAFFYLFLLNFLFYLIKFWSIFLSACQIKRRLPDLVACQTFRVNPIPPRPS